MADDLPIQSSILYRGNWTHQIDSMILRTMIRLKQEYGSEGTMFPSHFIFEAKSVIENQLGISYEWFELVDRIHFLERRFRTFNELVHLEGTYWNAETNTIIVMANTWCTRLAGNPLLGAYHRYGDPAYNQLCELFAFNDVKEEIEGTVVVISDSLQSHGHVCNAPHKNTFPTEMGEVNSNNKFSLARRKLMFDEGGHLDLESTNKKFECNYMPDMNGKLERVEKQIKGRILPRPFPPKSPTPAYSCASSKPVTCWRMPRKPNI